MRQAVGAAVQFAVAQTLIFKSYGQCVPSGVGLLFEQAVNGQRLRVGGTGRVQVMQHALPLAVIEQFDAIHYTGVIGSHGAEDALEITQITLGRRLVEQCRGIFQGAQQTTVRFTEVQRQVELGDIVQQRQVFEHQFAQRRFPDARLLPTEHGLEHGAVRQAAQGIEDLYDLLEWQILVLLGREGLSLDPCQQGFDARLRRGVDTDCQSIDEEAYQRFDFGACAVGHGRTDHHVVLT